MRSAWRPANPSRVVDSSAAGIFNLSVSKPGMLMISSPNPHSQNALNRRNRFRNR
jgi:hypothetical protein